MAKAGGRLSWSQEGPGPSGEQHPPWTNTPCLCWLSGKIFVCLGQGFLKASAFSSVSFLQETDQYENKAPDQSQCPRPTLSVFLPCHSQKGNINSDVQYFRWSGRKKPLCFSDKVAFHSEVGGSSKKPACSLQMQTLPYGSHTCLCIRRLGVGRKQHLRVLTVVFPQDPPSWVGDRWPFVHPL